MKTKKMVICFYLKRIETNWNGARVDNLNWNELKWIEINWNKLKRIEMNIILFKKMNWNWNELKYIEMNWNILKWIEIYFKKWIEIEMNWNELIRNFTPPSTDLNYDFKSIIFLLDDKNGLFIQCLLN